MAAFDLHTAVHGTMKTFRSSLFALALLLPTAAGAQRLDPVHVEDRFNQLQQSITLLTGQIEQLQYRNQQLEQQLETDKEFAQNVSQSGLYRHAVRTVRWAAIGLIAGLAFTIATLQIHFALAFLGFLGMLACAVVIEGKLRAMSKAGYKDVVQVLRTASLNSKAKMRSKFDRNN